MVSNPDEIKIPDYVQELNGVCVKCQKRPTFQMYDSGPRLTCYPCYVVQFEKDTLRQIARWGCE